MFRLRDCTGLMLDLENKEEEEEEKKNIAPSMCSRSNIHPWCVPWKTRPFSFSTFIRRSFSSDRSFSYSGYDDEEYPMLERESSIFFPRFFLFSIPSISFFFFFPFYVFARQHWLWYVVEQRFLSIIVFLSKICLQEFWHASNQTWKLLNHI